MSSASGGSFGSASTASPLSQFAATTSAQFAGVISDEVGTGKVILQTSPTLITPLLGTPTSGVLTNCTGTAAGLTAGAVSGATAVATANQPALYDASGLRVSGIEYLYSAVANTGALTSSVYLAGSATASIGIIPRRACTMFSLDICMSTLASAGVNPAFSVTAFKNSTVGGTSFLTIASGVVASTPIQGYSTSILNSAGGFNGTTDYFVIAITLTAGTSVTVGNLQVRLIGIYT